MSGAAGPDPGPGQEIPVKQILSRRIPSASSLPGGRARRRHRPGLAVIFARAQAST